jgi:hypothetical protein
MVYSYTQEINAQFEVSIREPELGEYKNLTYESTFFQLNNYVKINFVCSQNEFYKGNTISMNIILKDSTKIDMGAMIVLLGNGLFYRLNSSSNANIQFIEKSKLFYQTIKYEINLNIVNEIFRDGIKEIIIEGLKFNYHIDLTDEFIKNLKHMYDTVAAQKGIK